MSEKFILVNKNKIRYIEEGSSDNVLMLIHGLGASAERWEFVVPKLKQHFRLIIPDLIGFGYSDKPLADYTMDFFTNFISDFLDALNINKTKLIGSSMGGQIAVEFTANNNKHVEKLVLVSPSGIMKTSTPALDAYIMAALYPNNDSVKNAYESMAVSSEPIPRHILDGFEKRMKLPNAKMAFMSTLLGLKNAGDIVKKLQQILVPTLLIWGDLDPVIPKKYHEPFLKNIPNCRLLCMKDSGHTPYVDHPEEFVKHVLEFFET